MSTPSYPRPPFPAQSQDLPGSFREMSPRPDHGEESWRGAGRLSGCIALITGGDSGIGRAVAIAYAREGCDLVIGYLAEDGDAEDTAELLRAEGRKVLVVRSDLSTRAGCQNLVDQAVNRFGRIDILVNNAAHQEHFDRLCPNGLLGHELQSSDRSLHQPLAEVITRWRRPTAPS